MMAEEEAEIALLHQLQAGQENVAWENGGENGVEEADLPSNTEHNNQEVKKEVAADDQVLRALSPSSADNLSDDGEYDPSSVIPNPAIAVTAGEASRSSSQSSMRKRKTVGGFIADESDEDTDTSAPTQNSTSLLQPPGASTPKRTPSPLQTNVTQQDLQSPAENQDDSNGTANPSIIPSVNSSSTGLPPTVHGHGTQVLTSAGPAAQAAASVPKARLPNDKTGILEDRIKEDPRGDLDAWLSLISEHQKRNKLDDARAVYERFFTVFPQAAEIWVAWIEMELDNENRSAAEQIFGKSLLTVPNVQLWSVYLNYIRRVNDLTNDVTGNARATISQSYEFVLSNIGMDRDSGKIWQEYIQFIRSAPGQIGGSSWQDQQKMDQLRKAYQRAICVPMSSVNTLWKDYDQFEMGLNKMTGRKFLQEKSPAYMSARSANTALENVNRGLIRTTLPKLPPAHGFDGEQEYLQQVELWKKWISWELEDPLVLKADELDAYKQRVLYVFKQAVMALRFWPELWVDAAEWCYSNGLEKEGETFLNNGISANPESCLLAFKKADRLETTLATEEAGKNAADQGAIVRAPYDKLLDTLYDLIKQLKAREARDLAKLEESTALDASISAIISKAEDDDDEEDETEKAVREVEKANKTRAIQQGYASQAQLLSRTISFAWIALMRAMRRIQGKGAVKDAVGGSRQIFADARARGKITSDVYVASALIEHHVYKDPAGTKIFERGAKLFPEDEVFILEYLKHLLSIGDTTNARVAFETAVSRLIQKPELVSRAKPLYSYFHKYESKYGELSQIRKLEQRMAELFADDPKLLRFASRYSAEGFDPTAVRPIVSPATQMRPKTSLMPSIEQYTSVQNSPRPQFVQENSPRPQHQPAINSPKRPFPAEDLEDLNRPRKLARGESPLKGAAGRRLDQQKRLQQHGTPTWQSNAPPFVVPRDITFLLSIIPRADLYTSTKFNAEAMVRLLSQTHVPDYSTWKALRDQSQAQPQPQRYDGRPSTSYTEPPRSRDQTSYNYSSQDDRRATDAHSWQSQGSYGAYGSGPGPTVTHGGDSYLRPAPQGIAPQGLPPRPDSSGSGYYQSGIGGAPGTGNWQTQGPFLSPAHSWYYQADQFAPGYSYAR